MRNILVFCHDAGGANLLASIIRSERTTAKWSLMALKESPAWKIFNALGLETCEPDQRSLKEEIAAISPDMIFVGTGWNLTLHRDFLRIGKELSILTAAFLDHWVHYKERFHCPIHGLEKHLPDFTLVSDTKALELAKQLHMPSPLQIQNYYINRLLEKKQLPSSPNKSLLFISEPTRKVALTTYQDENYWGFSELSVLEDLLASFDRFSTLLGAEKIRIRLHPSDDLHTYNEIISRYKDLIDEVETPDKDLTHSILSSCGVIGIDGMPLFIAALLGKKVFAYLPGNREATIPLHPHAILRSLDDLPSHSHGFEQYEAILEGGSSLKILLEIMEKSA